MRIVKKIIALSLCLGLTLTANAKQTNSKTQTPHGDRFTICHNGQAVPVLYDPNEDAGIVRAINDLASDINKVTGVTSALKQGVDGSFSSCIIVGSVKSKWISELAKKGDISKQMLDGKWEKYAITSVKNPLPGISEALVIAGSDKRGTIYGIYEISQQIGISPWYYWADVPVKKQPELSVDGSYRTEEPAVRYRGIFLNDEAPALTGWANANFNGYKHLFYEKVFELLLRLKGNFLWPAMWDAAFYDDDSLNSKTADLYGIVMGTSHHEPMAKAHKEWGRYGNRIWNYDKNSAVLDEFWRKGIERMKGTEDVVTIGMRGDGDEPMSEESNIKLLERIVKNQRTIISKVTGKKPSETPQVWALYKEVQDYYDKGMRVPDDVTLLLCDDNWGNVRKLPDVNAPTRPGGYGMYYHFDYVGGPRNYKWLNVSQVQRIWEQMNLCYEHNVNRLWIVNVGDLKPMEYPITFFLDMAWNPKRFNPDNLFDHTVQFCKQQFGEKDAAECARLLNLYTKYNRRVTPELLNQKTYSLENYEEFKRVTDDYKELSLDALKQYYLLPESYRDAYDQLILFPVQACANLYEMYYAVAMNHTLAGKKDPACNRWAAKVKQLYERDSTLCLHYNKVMANGKWNHMMDQTHIGYTYWQQPDKNTMPNVFTLPEDTVPQKSKCFIEENGYVSIEAENFARKAESEKVRWAIIPHLGKTVSGITTLPSNIEIEKQPEKIYLEYDMDLVSSGTFELQVLFAPTLNFNQNKGLRYAVSFDGGAEQLININQKYTIQEMEKWQANSINSSVSSHTLEKGSHTLKVRVLDSGLVIEKIILNTGGLKPSYLGPLESKTK